MKRFDSISYFFFLRNFILRAFLVKTFSTKTAKRKNSVYYFSTFFPENAGSQWRVQKWCDALQEHHFETHIGYATTKDEFYSLYPDQSIQFQKNYLKRRFKQILESRDYEIVIVRRELLLFNDYGGLFILKLLLHFHPQAILDFDDDIAASKNQPKEITHPYAKLMLENGNQFNDSLKMHLNFITGTDFLKKLVLEQNILVNEENICVIPTCVDYEKYTPKVYDSEKSVITLGWVGSDGNYPLLDEIIGDIEDLSKEFQIELLVIGGQEYVRKTNFPIHFYPWSLETEIEHIKKIDLGLMPLDQSKVSEGKAGFKLIQYMALGIVSIGSEIAFNKEIIPSSHHGYLVEDDWFSELKNALQNIKKFPEIGQNGRQHVLSKYTFTANEEKYLSFIRQVQQKSQVS